MKSFKEVIAEETLNEAVNLKSIESTLKSVFGKNFIKAEAGTDKTGKPYVTAQVDMADSLLIQGKAFKKLASLPISVVNSFKNDHSLFFNFS